MVDKKGKKVTTFKCKGPNCDLLVTYKPEIVIGVKMDVTLTCKNGHTHDYEVDE